MHKQTMKFKQSVLTLVSPVSSVDIRGNSIIYIRVGQQVDRDRLVDRRVSIVRSRLICIELTRYLQRTLFNLYSRKYIKIIHGLVGHVCFWCLLRFLTIG